MLSPYDWQESVSQRAQYIETRLRGGSPIVGLSTEAGAILYTYRKQVRKVYEVYDCLMFAALGQQADVENMRSTAVDFAHQEGFARSESDVTIGRVVGFALSAPLKRAFGDITTAPFVIHAVFAEMCHDPKGDVFFRLHYDGDFEILHGFAAAAGTREAEERMSAELQKRYKPGMGLDEALKLADDAWMIGADRDASGEADPELLRDARAEVGLLDRNTPRERKFRLL